MDITKVQYGWMKIVDNATPHPPNPKCDGSLDPCSANGSLKMEIIHRPPRVAALKTGGQLPDGVSECCETGTPFRKTVADRKKHGLLAIDATYKGKPLFHKTFELAQFVGTRDQAIEWLSDTPEGQTWISDADNYGLVIFAPPSAFSNASQDASQERVAPVLSPDSPAAERHCRYQDEDWRPDFLSYLDKPYDLLSQDWHDLVTLPNPPWDRSQAECDLVVAASALRESRRQLVFDQADSIDAVAWPVLKAIAEPLGQNQLGPKNTRLLETLIENLLRPIFTLKYEFKRGRPWACCDGRVTSMFEPESDLFPAHPAYPSGHATLAHAAACVYAIMFPARAWDLHQHAAGVAENRVVAGVHYPSDSAAGKTLAEALVPMLMENERFVAMAALAKAEWEA